MKKIFLFFTIIFILSGCSDKIVRFVLMPDTQTYANAYPHVFRSQTEWIREHADSIDFVLHQGDITHTNSDNEWEIARDAMFLLDGKTPYSIILGNHDGSAQFNKFFPYAKYSKEPAFGGAYEQNKMDNIWQTFEAGGHKWLVFSLEFLPRNKILEWANEVSQQHPDYKIIVNTHAYMYSDNTRLGTGDKGIPQNMEKETGDEAKNNGEMMWDKLVSRHPNMMFVFSGHIVYHNGTGKLVSRGVHGNEVYQMLANYQREVPGGNPDDGWLRIITVNFTKKEIDVKTYSPRLNKYRTENDQQFKICMD
ncbi:MAG: metallophosphoesterase [Prevotellaceae bacterium]|jgi:predicted phosphodiesterase|nr:metallophosphoesterase [Prevotellaceae bacterium]